MTTYTNSLAIIQRIQADLITSITPLLPGLKINLDEPNSYVWNDLPVIAVYPMKEDYVEESASQTQDFKQLHITIEIWMKGCPASSVVTPIVQAIAACIRADRTLGGLAMYVELGTIQWANTQIGSGLASAASLELRVDYCI